MRDLRQPELRINVPPAPSCRICGAATRGRYHLAGYTLLVCRTCGLGQLDPLPAPGELERIYSSAAYFENEEGAGYADYERRAGEFALTFRAKIRRLLSYGRLDDLLEIGCGPGYFLAAAEQLGIERVVGFDRNPEAVERARNSGLTAFVGSIDDVPAEQRYDAVAMFDVLEHIPEPMTFLAAVRRHLQPNGRVFIMTPNIESLLARISGPRWVSFKVPEHLYYFTHASLARLLADNGFRVLSSRGTGQYVSVAFFLDRLGRLAPWLSRLIEMPARRLDVMDRLIYVPNGSIDLIAQAMD